MLGANDITVSRSKSCTEKATSLPVVGFFIRKSTIGTRGTLVGRPEVERTLEPADDERELEEGTVGVTVLMAELADLTGLEAAWEERPAGRDRARQRAMAESFAMRAFLIMPIALKLPQAIALAGEEIPVAALLARLAFTAHTLAAHEGR